MRNKQKLELTWIGKDDVAKLEPRILIEDTELSYHAPKRHSDADLFDNKLVHGDNLLALKALEQEYAGKVKCVFIDPPYNTGSAFSQYDDGIEHSLWLSLIRDRLELIKRLMSDDGSLWITVDDNEAHYLKVLCDEIFGRNNFVTNAIWQKKYTIANDAKYFSDTHDHIIVYAKDKSKWRINKIPRSDEMNARYRNPDNHPRGVWKSTPLHAKSGSEKNKSFTYTFKNGVTWSPPAGTFPRFSTETLNTLDANGEIWFGKDGSASPSRKSFLADMNKEGTPPTTIWLHDDVGNNHQARDEVKKFNAANPFDTPKPEKLLQRIIHLATDSGEIVLDSFAGSGTTGSVAHKMGRRWIMVELGEHCETHILPRLIKVIDGEDAGGITEAVSWQGGGGFRYYKLAPSLLAKDKWGNWVINKDYDANQLAAAVCKHEGFTYSPSETEWWAHGYSTETDFIYFTTQTLTEEQLLALSEDVGSERTLLVCCSAFKTSASMLSDKLTNLTIKKMPNALLSKCEWGKDDYSLNVSKLPVAEQDDEQEVATKKKASNKEADLFSDNE